MRLPLTLASVPALLLFALAVQPADAQKFPEPSPYPISWELTLDYKEPGRIVINVPGKGPKAYWYLPYTITNEGEETQTFIPQFEMLTEDGKVHRARKDVPRQVFDAIKSRERNRLMVPPTKV